MQVGGIVVSDYAAMDWLGQPVRLCELAPTKEMIRRTKRLVEDCAVKDPFAFSH